MTRNPGPAEATPRLAGPNVVRPRAARLRALIALTSRVRVSPRERFGRLSFEDLMETASLGDGLEA